MLFIITTHTRMTTESTALLCCGQGHLPTDLWPVCVFKWCVVRFKLQSRYILVCSSSTMCSALLVGMTASSTRLLSCACMCPPRLACRFPPYL